MFLWLAQSPAKEITTVRLASIPAAWQVFLIVALVLAFAAASYLLEPKVQRNRLKLPLAIIRAALILLAVGILFRPLKSTELIEERQGLVVLAVDTSHSMSLLDKEKDDELRERIASALELSADRVQELSRLERVTQAMSVDGGKFLDELATQNRVRLYGFDTTRTRKAEIEKLGEATGEADDDDRRFEQVQGALSALNAAEATGSATHLGDSLQRILTDVRSERVAALILLTDGRSNGGSLDPSSVAARFGRKGVPVFAVGVGDPQPQRNLSVDDLRAPKVSLAGDLLRGSFLVRASGYEEPRDVRVRVKLESLEVFSEQGLVGGDRPEWEVQFSIPVPRPGKFVLRVEVEADPDEFTEDDNWDEQEITVIDERIKVLYIEGYPRWEYRFLKNALIRDEHMDSQILLLSADEGWVQEHSETASPLTKLPGPKELAEYHVIVIGDVNPDDPVFYDGALEVIKDLVKERGGGLMMLAGERSAPREYVGTPIADVLPVKIDPSGTRNQDFSRAFRLELTREGRESDLLQLEDSAALNETLWDQRLPDLYWFMRSDRAKPQAHVLAVHPTARNSQGNYPLIAWQRYGAGTSFWLGFDEAWRWRAEVGDKYHYKFYGQIVRFLSLQSFTRTKRFFVTTDKSEYNVGEEVRVRAEIRDPEAIADPERQEVVLSLPDGSRENLVLPALEGEEGKYEGSYRPIQVGRYSLKIDPGDLGSESEVATRDFDVKLPRLELEEPQMNEEGLRALARASEGQFLRLDAISSIPEQIQPLVERIPYDSDDEELWDRSEVFLLFLVLLLVEWIGRKAARLL